jgi:hypothetical protein
VDQVGVTWVQKFANSIKKKKKKKKKTPLQQIPMESQPNASSGLNAPLFLQNLYIYMYDRNYNLNACTRIF